MDTVEIARGIGVNQNGRLTRSGERWLQIIISSWISLQIFSQISIPAIALVTLRMLPLRVRRLRLLRLKLVVNAIDISGVGDREVVLATLKIARETGIEHGELRTEFPTITTSVPGPIRSNLPREGGIAGED